MIDSVKFKADLTILDRDQIEKIHKASLSIIANTGVKMKLSADRYDALQGFGAEVDRQQNRVRFPSNMIEKALEISPSAYYESDIELNEKE